MGWFSDNCRKCNAKINKNQSICERCRDAEERDRRKEDHIGRAVTAVAGIIIASIFGGG